MNLNGVKVTRRMLPKDGTRHFGSINQGTVKLKLWQELPRTIGVYAFVSNKRYLYIGCSSDIRQRISAHNEHGFVVTGCIIIAMDLKSFLVAHRYNTGLLVVETQPKL